MPPEAVHLPSRGFAVPLPRRDYSLLCPPRELTARCGRRDFVYLNTPNRTTIPGGEIHDHWLNWGQDDIHPFMPGGEDSDKTFGELNG